jgi:hypothetical protein
MTHIRCKEKHAGGWDALRHSPAGMIELLIKLLFLSWSQCTSMNTRVSHGTILTWLSILLRVVAILAPNWDDAGIGVYSHV